MVAGDWAVLERHLALYRRLWRGSVFTFFAIPVFVLLSMGLGVGTYVGRVDGVDYLVWIAPAVAAMTAFQIGASESTYGILSDLRWVGGLHVMRSSPLRVSQMIMGWLLYVLLVTVLALVVFLAVALAFGALRTGGAVALPLIGGLVSLAISAPTVAFAVVVPTEEYFLLQARFLIVPTTLFSGVFFEVDRLPTPVEWFAEALPLWHGVELSRAVALSQQTAWPWWLHTVVLLVWVAGGVALAVAALRRHLSR